MTDDNTFNSQINYELLVESALREVVRSSLKIAEQNGLPGDAHFYITFLTEYNGVNIPPRLRETHPERMTIILQHQFWDLDVREDDFSISLSFGGRREMMVVPFMSVIDFNDPSVGFGLQFAIEGQDDDDEDDERDDDNNGIDAQDDNDQTHRIKTPTKKPQGKKPQGKKPQAQKPQVSADVVSLDTFRKKTP
ncbi:MAG: SspB family protein [Candidatus Puniceispirillales bacterium WSBS_2018_MAG_OTU23]